MQFHVSQTPNTEAPTKTFKLCFRNERNKYKFWNTLQKWKLDLYKVSFYLHFEWIERWFKLDSTTENGTKIPSYTIIQSF